MVAPDDVWDVAGVEVVVATTLYSSGFQAEVFSPVVGRSKLGGQIIEARLGCVSRSLVACRCSRSNLATLR